MQKMTKRTSKKSDLKAFAKLDSAALLDQLKTSTAGLRREEATRRLEDYGPNIIENHQLTAWYVILWHAFRNPFSLVLAFLAVVSVLTAEYEPALYICLMIIVSAAVSFIQEYKSQKASDALREMIENTTYVKRENEYHEIPMDEIVPGDIIKLQTGDMIPADAILLQSKDLFINQASLTGESFPVEKKVPEKNETVAQKWDQRSVMDIPNVLFMGTDVLSGSGEIVIIKTGKATMFGDIAKQSSSAAKIQSSFDKGINQISRLMLMMVAILFPIVFFINWFTKGLAFDAFFFAIAVAVGLTPEMLPMIVNTNLAKGAVALSKKKVIVKELAAIQNLGAMDILCTDKTGTLTEDRVVMMTYVDAKGKKQEDVLNAAFINAYFQTGWKNLMDIAVIQYFEKGVRNLDHEQMEKVDEIPFDFSRRLLSVVVNDHGRHLMVTKGAVEEMDDICTHVMENGIAVPITAEKLDAIRKVNLEMNLQGMRVLTVGQRILTDDELENFDQSSEKEMTLLGFIGFLDPAKASSKNAVTSLHEHGVSVKVLTGDNAIVAKKVCEDVGISAAHYYLGTQIDDMSDEVLYEAARNTHLFAKLSPLQKSRIIEVLRKSHTVGFMGDGINDAPALRAADIGISVDTAADITKEASSIILLEKSLEVLETGVIEGRKVFSNMMKYIRITLSSNFGNVFSVLVASAFLPFLPMLSVQLLTLNLIYDISQLTIPWDNVDSEEIEKPVQWGTRGLAKFVVMIGPLSSIFDIATFGVLWFILGYQSQHLAPFFQAGWFIESLATQALAFHILRTRHVPFLKSRAARGVIFSTLGAFIVGILFLETSIGQAISLRPVEPQFWFWWMIIVVTYVIVLQIGKIQYYKKRH